MNYLVDTHTFLWSVFSSKKLTKKVTKILLSPEHTKYISIVTFWEISLKFALGKIELFGILPDELPTAATDAGFLFLNLDAEIVATFYKLPKIANKDPFDRLLAWQAIRQDHQLITKDQEFSQYQKYGLKIVW